MIKPKILITGATGKTGGPAALQLLAKGYPVRAFVHALDGRAEQLRRAGAEIFPGSLEDFRDLAHAMHGVARAYFCPPLLPGTLRRAVLFAAAAREAKLEAAVQLSQWVADPLHPAVHAREKWLSNEMLSWLPGVAVVTVQPGWFADNYFAVIGQAAQFGLMALPLGEGLNAPPSNEDIARVIVACLVDPAPHIGKAYRPTGPRTLAPAEIAAVIGKALRRPVRYQDAPISLFLKAATSLGLSDFVIAQLYWFLQDYQQNAFGVGAPTNVVEEIGGSPPEAFDTIAARYVAASPLAKRGFAATLREGAGLMAALMARPQHQGDRNALQRPAHRQFRLGDRLGALAVDACAVPGLSLIRPPARSETDRGRCGSQRARRPQPVRGPPCPAFTRSGLRPASFLTPM